MATTSTPTEKSIEEFKEWFKRFLFTTRSYGYYDHINSKDFYRDYQLGEDAKRCAIDYLEEVNVLKRFKFEHSTVEAFKESKLVNFRVEYPDYGHSVSFTLSFDDEENCNNFFEKVDSSYIEIVNGVCSPDHV